MQGTVAVALAVSAFPVLCVLAFLGLPKRRAVIVLLVFGWLLLPATPPGVLRVPILHAKLSWLPACVLLASLLTDRGRWMRFRPGWFDLPLLLYPAAAAASSLVNRYGGWDATAQGLNTFFQWTASYLLGRVYVSDLRGMSDLAVGIVEGGLLYAPLCLWEIRMSPRLNEQLYGFMNGSWDQTRRYAGFRPAVFLDHGLMTALWMGMAAVTAWALWRSGAVKSVWRLPMRWVAPGLLAVAVLCKSTGAILLTLLGIAVLSVPARLRRSVLIVCLLSVPPAYCLLRANGWSGGVLVTVAGDLIDRDRARSLHARVVNEDRLMERAARRPLLGWGRWGESRVRDEEGNDISITDGLWILKLGTDGIAGLLLIGASLVLPVLLLLAWAPAQTWMRPWRAPAAATALVLILYTIDCLPNAMVNPIYTAAAGALTGLYVTMRDTARSRSRLAWALAHASARMPANR